MNGQSSMNKESAISRMQATLLEKTQENAVCIGENGVLQIDYSFIFQVNFWNFD